MILEYSWKEGYIGVLDTLEINAVHTVEVVDNPDVHVYLSSNDFYIRNTGYIKVNGVKITGGENIVHKLQEIMILERDLGIPDEKMRITRKKKLKV